MSAQEWTPVHGERAGLWPSWLAYQLASVAHHVATGQTTGRSRRKHNGPTAGIAARSLQRHNNQLHNYKDVSVNRNHTEYF